MFLHECGPIFNERGDLTMFIAGDTPDVILITEVIPKKQVNPITHALLDIDDYKCLLNINPEDPNLGSSGIRGVAIYTKETLKVEEVEMEVEGCKDHAWIEIHTVNGESLSCGCVYRSPSNDSTIDGQSTNAVINLIKKAYQRNHNLFIVGYFNYKHIDWCNDYSPLEKQHLRDFIEVLQNCFLHQQLSPHDTAKMKNQIF